MRIKSSSPSSRWVGTCSDGAQLMVMVGTPAAGGWALAGHDSALKGLVRGASVLTATIHIFNNWNASSKLLAIIKNEKSAVASSVSQIYLCWKLVPALCVDFLFCFDKHLLSY
jgi:hypothetical protein